MRQLRQSLGLQSERTTVQVRYPSIFNVNQGFHIKFIRHVRIIESSFHGYSDEQRVLFLYGRPRDENLFPILPAPFLKRISKSFDGILGTTGLYIGALLDLSTLKLSIFCDPHASGCLYWYADENIILISDQLDWVAKQGNKKLHIDSMAWSECLSTHVILGDRTYFEEIKSVTLQQIVIFDLNTDAIFRENKHWYLYNKTPFINIEKASADLADLFHEGISKYSEQFRSINLALSGGLDSRMILSSFTRNGTGVNAFTTDTDIGFGNDRLYASKIAEIYGVKHRYLELDQNWYENIVDDYFEHTAYESWFHVWFQGFIDNLPNLRTHPFFTGNDGDGLLRSSHLPVPSDDLEAMYMTIKHQSFHLIFKNRYNNEISSRSLLGFKEEYSSCAGYPASILFFRLNNRMRRNIHWMLRQGTEKGECISGFQYPPFVSYVLGLPDEVKFDPRLQFEVMGSLDPKTLDHPSTHPAMHEKHVQTYIRKYNRSTLKKFSNLLIGDGIINNIGLLDTYLTRKWFNQWENLEYRFYPQFVITQPIYMLAKWLESYKNILHLENSFQ